MNETELGLAVGRLAEEALKDLLLPTKTGELKPPLVFDGYLPPKKELPDDNVPYVVVRVTDGETDLEESLATVAIIVGCYSTESDGYCRCLEILQRLRNALFRLPAQVLDRRFRLTLPIVWGNVVEAYPQWQAEMTTKWAFRPPQVVDQF